MEQTIINNKEDIKALPQDIIRLCHNEYIRRWAKNNRDKINAYQREHYKKHNTMNNNPNDNMIKGDTNLNDTMNEDKDNQKNSNDTMKEEIDNHNDTMKKEVNNHNNNMDIYQ